MATWPIGPGLGRGITMRVLLISHEASRSGAPKVAVLVARSLVGQGHHVQIVSRTRGPLLEEFAAVAPVDVEFFDRVRRRLRSAPGLGSLTWLIDTLVAFSIIAWRRPDLVYVNSTAAAIYLRPARWLRRSALLHGHESGGVTTQFLLDAKARSEITNVFLVACSPSVQADLAQMTGVAAGRVVLLPSVPDDARVMSLSDQAVDAGLGVGRGLVVGCCGTVESRKGADLWVAMARRVQDALPDLEVRFIWIGDIGDPSITVEDEKIEFVGPLANPYPVMRTFDIATLPSRDDPFPLVVLESMILGKPVVAFAVGAVADQIGRTGVLVPPGDVDGFAEAVVALLLNQEERSRLGIAALERAREHYSTAAFAHGLDIIVRGIRNSA